MNLANKSENERSRLFWLGWMLEVIDGMLQVLQNAPKGFGYPEIKYARGTWKNENKIKRIKL